LGRHARAARERPGTAARRGVGAFRPERLLGESVQQRALRVDESKYLHAKPDIVPEFRQSVFVGPKPQPVDGVTQLSRTPHRDPQHGSALDAAPQPSSFAARPSLAPLPARALASP